VTCKSLLQLISEVLLDLVRPAVTPEVLISSTKIVVWRKAALLSRHPALQRIIHLPHALGRHIRPQLQADNAQCTHA